MNDMPANEESRWYPIHRNTPPFTPPGTVVVDPEAPAPVIHVMAFGPDEVIEEHIRDVADIERFRHRSPVLWVNVDGLGDAEVIRRIGEMFHLHRLALEDVVHVHQRAKVEQYEEHLFIVARMICPADFLQTEQLSMFLGRDFVITFQEMPGDCLDALRLRIREKRGRVRQAGADYLAYALLDTVTDAYFPVLEEYGGELDQLEGVILDKPVDSNPASIHGIKSDLLLLRRSLWPLRETVGALMRESMPYITSETRLYLRDCADHTVQALDLVDVYRELADNLMELYHFTMSAQTNDVMRVLTMIATVFIPVTFVASIYGMNFRPEASPWNMPELSWMFGYPAALSLMAAIAGAIVYFFWRKGWLASLIPPRRHATPPEAHSRSDVDRENRNRP